VTRLFTFTQMSPASPATRRLLYLAAAFNAAAVPILLGCARLAPQVLGLDPMSPSQAMYVDLAAWLIACFGLGYGLAGTDLVRFWPFVALGAFAKAGVVVVAFGYASSGQAGPLVALLASGDAVFAVLFVRLLQRHGAAGAVACEERR
jgi:hypothetical protein